MCFCVCKCMCASLQVVARNTSFSIKEKYLTTSLIVAYLVNPSFEI